MSPMGSRQNFPPHPEKNMSDETFSKTFSIPFPSVKLGVHVPVQYEPFIYTFATIFQVRHRFEQHKNVCITCRHVLENKNMENTHLSFSICCQLSRPGLTCYKGRACQNGAILMDRVSAESSLVADVRNYPALTRSDFERSVAFAPSPSVTGAVVGAAMRPAREDMTQKQGRVVSFEADKKDEVRWNPPLWNETGCGN